MKKFTKFKKISLIILLFSFCETKVFSFEWKDNFSFVTGLVGHIVYVYLMTEAMDKAGFNTNVASPAFMTAHVGAGLVAPMLLDRAGVDKNKVAHIRVGILSPGLYVGGSFGDFIIKQLIKSDKEKMKQNLDENFKHDIEKACKFWGISMPQVRAMNIEEEKQARENCELLRKERKDVWSSVTVSYYQDNAIVYNRSFFNARINDSCKPSQLEDVNVERRFAVGHEVGHYIPSNNTSWDGLKNVLGQKFTNKEVAKEEQRADLGAVIRACEENEPEVVYNYIKNLQRTPRDLKLWTYKNEQGESEAITTGERVDWLQQMQSRCYRDKITGTYSMQKD